MSFLIPRDRQWLTAAEAAAEKLPGLPSKRALQSALADSTIPSRNRQDRGGGREFHWTDLPRAARDEYLKRHGTPAAAQEPTDPKAKDAARDLKCEARRLIVEAAKALIVERNLRVGKGLETFSKLYRKRQTALEPWIHEIEPVALPHQVRSWDRTIRAYGAGALLDARGRPKSTRLFDRDTQLRAYVLSQIAARPHLACAGPLGLKAAILTDLKREVSLRTLQSFLANFRACNAPVYKALVDPDRYRSHHQPAFGSRGMNAVRINQVWELDATVADAMCLTESGTQRRFKLTGVIDVTTRRGLVLVSDQPRALATQALLRRAILAWGLPETLRTDNGKEFKNRAVMRFCEAMGIAIHWSRPFTPEEKPHIESFFGTLNSQLFPALPVFVGANIVQRQAIEHRMSFAHRFGEEARLTLETSLSPYGLQARIDAYLRDIYERAPHGGLKGRTPFDVGMVLGAEAKRIADERALDLLLFDAPDAGGIRTVQKDGVRIHSRFYIAGELGGMTGDKVHVRMDPHDPARIVVYSHDGKQFLCLAKYAELLEGAERMAIAREALSLSRKRVNAWRSDARKVQQLYPSDGLADRILIEASGGPGLDPGFVLDEPARAAMEMAARPRLLQFRAAAEALDADQRPAAPIEPTAEQRENAAAMIAEIHLRDAPRTVEVVQCDGYTRPQFDRDDDYFLWMKRFAGAGGTLDEIDARNFRELAADATLQTIIRLRGAA
jgi:putative transposase